MNASWFILFNLYLIFWLLIYLLFFSRSSWFKMSRFVLLSGIFWASVLPWIYFPWEISNKLTITAPSAISSVSTIHGMVQGIQPMTTTYSGLSLMVWPVAVTLYWSGVAVMSVLFLMRLIRLYSFIGKYPRHHEDGYVRVITQLPHEIFSFGRYLFAPDDTPDAILQHELNHIRSGHTIDSLVLEVMKVFCWFNPAVYVYAKAVKTLHEYMADARASAAIEKEAYAKMLASYVFRIPGAGFTDHFYNHSQLQKRIIMLQKQNSSRKAGRKYLLIVPLLAALTVISVSSFTLKNKVDDMISKLSSSIQPFDIKGIVMDQDGNPIPKATVFLVNTMEGAITNDKGQFEIKNVSKGGLLVVSMIGYTTINVEIKSEKRLHLTLYSEPSRLNQIVVTGYSDENPISNSKPSKLNPKVVTGYPIEKPTSQSSQLNPKTAMGYPVERANHKSAIAFVEQMPSFPGGEDRMMKFLHDNVRYPQQARREQLQGTVVVSFVVDKDGSLSQVHTIGQTVGGGLEQEAVRVIKAMPKWIPGHQNGEAVAVPYTLPIWFVLQ